MKLTGCLSDASGLSPAAGCLALGWAPFLQHPTCHPLQRDTPSLLGISWLRPEFREGTGEQVISLGEDPEVRDGESQQRAFPATGERAGGGGPPQPGYSGACASVFVNPNPTMCAVEDKRMVLDTR